HAGIDSISARRKRLERAVGPPAMQALARVPDASNLQALVLVVIRMLAGNEVDAVRALRLKPFAILARDRNEADDHERGLVRSDCLLHLEDPVAKHRLGHR